MPGEEGPDKATRDSVWVSARTELWIAWAEIAVERERDAFRGRRMAIRAMDETERVAKGLENETIGAMQTAVSAAACLETVGNNLAQFLASPPRARRASNRFVDTVNAVFGPAIDRQLNDAVNDVFTLRNDTMHYRSDWQSVDIHPALGIRTTWVARMYSAEAAARSVTTLISVLRVATNPGRSSSDPAEFWAIHWRTLPDELQASRAKGFPAVPRLRSNPLK